jgi:arylsulfatase A-like enzyme/Tfp pilus assembly protein PilF
MVDFSSVMRALQRLVCLLLLAGCAAAATPPPPNVILITLDTTRADRMGFLGSKRGLTPNLDALARQGVVFSCGYAHVPITTPSHATILTGTYPQFNHVNDFGVFLAKDLPYLPQILHDQGYKTAAFVGSVILDPVNGGAPGFDRGFDTYDAGFRAARRGEDRSQPRERLGGDVVARALGWLNEHPAGPFFLWVHLFDPHIPYKPPEPFKSRYASEPYDGEIAYADSVLGNLLDQLRSRGLYDGALIAMMADHGEALGEHGEGTHGVFLYDETIHVPLLFKLPGKIFEGTRVDARASLVDVMPTILEIAGIPVPAAVQGQSLVALMKPAEGRGPVAAKAADPVPDRPAYAENDYPQRAYGWSSLRALRTGKYLFVQAPRKELYDQSADPKAEHDLSSTASAVSATLTDRLDAFRQRTKSSTEAAKVEADPQREQLLAALGYVASGDAGPATGGEQTRADPKDKIEIANQLQDALVAAEDQRYEEAIVLLKQVLAKDPNIAVAYRALGTALISQKNYGTALPALRKAVELHPDNTTDHYELGLALFDSGDLEAAKAQLEAAIALSPRLANLHYTLAGIYNHMDRAADARKELETALQLQPEDYDSNLTLGRLLTTQENPAGALPYLKKAADLQPDSPDAHLFLADAYSRLGQQADALRERIEARRLKGFGRP